MNALVKDLEKKHAMQSAEIDPVNCLSKIVKSDLVTDDSWIEPNDRDRVSPPLTSVQCGAWEDEDELEPLVSEKNVGENYGGRSSIARRHLRRTQRR